MKSKYIDSTLTQMSELGAEQMQLFQPKTLLMVVRSGILRRTLPIAILRQPSTVNQDIKTISFFVDDICEFVYFYLLAQEEVIRMKYAKSGTTVESINFEELKDISIPFPPIAEQCRIVAAIESAFAVIDEIERNKTDLQAAIATAKQKILSLAIRGKLVPQNPNDEPASVLLERIRAEQEQLIREEKIKRGKDDSTTIKSDDNSYYKELPESWGVVSLAEITNPSVLNDGDWILSDNMVTYGSVKLIQLGSIGYMEYVNKGFKYLSSKMFKKLNCTAIHTGYLLVNRLLGDKLNVCLLPDIDGMLITTVDTCCIAPHENYNLRFLMYTIASESFQKTVTLKSAGSTRKRISKGNLIQVPFAFPPLAEQHRIVSAIEAAFYQLDRVTALLA